jgi:hypothetical protein
VDAKWAPLPASLDTEPQSTQGPRRKH